MNKNFKKTSSAKRSRDAEKEERHVQPIKDEQEDEDDDGEETVTSVGSSKSKKAKLNNTIVNDEGVEMYELGNKRYVSVSEFKGKKLVNIREYYEKDGKLLPGKKGISLSQDQYNKLKELLDKIDDKLPAVD